jgi:hypothetical protein
MYISIEISYTAIYAGAEDRRPPPDNRTHESFVRDAHKELNHLRNLERGTPGFYKNNSPYKTTGVKELSPLTLIPLFDIVWDVMPDMMHITTGVWQRHIFGALRGVRMPAVPKRRQKWSDKENKALMDAHKKVRAELERWTLSKVYTCTYRYIPLYTAIYCYILPRIA